MPLATGHEIIPMATRVASTIKVATIAPSALPGRPAGRGRQLCGLGCCRGRVVHRVIPLDGGLGATAIEKTRARGFLPARSGGHRVRLVVNR